jgi:hypothetical protein
MADEIRGNSVYQAEPEPEVSQTPSPVEKPQASQEKKPGLLAKYVHTQTFSTSPWAE